MYSIHFDFMPTLILCLLTYCIYCPIPVVCGFIFIVCSLFELCCGLFPLFCGFLCFVVVQFLCTVYFSIAFSTFIPICYAVHPWVSNNCHFPNPSMDLSYISNMFWEDLAQHVRVLNVWRWTEPDKIKTCLCLASGQQLEEVRGPQNMNNIKTRTYSCVNSHNSFSFHTRRMAKKI